MNQLRTLWIKGPAGRLECTLRIGCRARAAAVLAHPHPLFGGTLHNPVIFHADRELHRHGWTTLRFNFRGVGTSEGTHDEGLGEVDDVGAAVGWLRGAAADLPLVVVGYSFGSWCGVRYAIGDSSVAGIVAIAPPVRAYDFAEITPRLKRPLAVVQGSEDEFGRPHEVTAALEGAIPKARFYAIPGASHLFPGRTQEAAALVVEAADHCLRLR